MYLKLYHTSRSISYSRIGTAATMCHGCEGYKVTRGTQHHQVEEKKRLV